MNIKKEFTYILRRVIVAIIIILIMAFIDSKIPKALSLYSSTIGTNQITGHDRAYNGFFMKDNLSLNTDWTINYTLTNINISNYDYLIMHLYFNYYDDVTFGTTTNEYQPVENTQYYCSSWVQKQQTYADGTQSNYYECEIWSPSGQSSTYQTSSITEVLYNNKVQIQADLLMDDNYWSVCTIQNDSNGVSTLTCPLNDNRTKINRIRLRYTSLHWGESSQTKASVGLSNVYNLYRDPVRDLIIQENNNTQSIINNQNQNQQQAHQDAQETNNTIKDSSVDSNNASTTINNASSLLPTDNNVSSLVGLPITFVESVLNGISGTCRPIHLFDLNMSQLENSTASDWSFTLDCIDLSEILGNTWVIIDTIISALLVYAIAKFFVRIFIKITQMDYNIVEEAYKS